eukprot:TRINITY_DN1154_c0_g1_i30.p1 TRINITY_DN1154_c0_g1~~TRINITY_DN1154_c0_g1_i30.p1  ORF type:complete len:331 (+),score=74.69 TRINITY_DN1154_c0_g1_i30:479-1471(+)
MQNEKGAAWSLVAAKFNEVNGNKRTGRQCRERWRNHLDPEINKEKWTDEEDIILLEGKLDYGNKWVELRKKLKGRSENSIKNRYNTLYKHYFNKNKVVTVDNVNGALEAAIKEKTDDREWIKILLEQKKNKSKNLESTSNREELVSNQISEFPADDMTLNKAPAVEPESEENKAKNFGQYTCPNLRYINRFYQRKRNFINDAELFINPITQQKVYISEQGIFLLNSFDVINPLINLEQIKRSNKMLNTPVDTPSQHNAKQLTPVLANDMGSPMAASFCLYGESERRSQPNFSLMGHGLPESANQLIPSSKTAFSPLGLSLIHISEPTRPY